MNILLIGAPGAGKGTQAKRLSEALHVPHISSGDLFRANIDNGTAIGIEANKFIEHGNLVPDELTVQMIQNRLAQPDASGGAILDGFPRTVGQVPLLDTVLANQGKQLDRVLILAVPEEVLLQRLGGRLVCRTCQATYHETLRPPKIKGRCDICGGELYQRQDDSLKTAKNRLRVYREQTAPIIEHYRKVGLLREVNGDQPPDAVTASLLAAINAPDQTSAPVLPPG